MEARLRHALCACTTLLFGLAFVECAAEGTKGECSQDTDCPGSQRYCDLSDQKCKTRECVPDCGTRECGSVPNGCGTSCGGCTAPETCNAQSRCEDLHGKAGDACPFDTGVNSGAPECAPGLKCLGVPADGQAGTCQDKRDCAVLGPTWNPACLAGKCGASFCAGPCDNQGACATGFSPNDVADLGCYCVPVPSSSGCDPVEETGCLPNQTCLPTSGTATRCFPEGSVKPGQPCSTTNRCVAGFFCGSLEGGDICLEFCDADTQTGCASGAYCVGIDGVERWGACVEQPCLMENMSSECQTGQSCIPVGETCDVLRCVDSGGLKEGKYCPFLNSCYRGLLCLGDNLCHKLCTLPNGAECTAPQVCMTMSGCSDAWGVCGVP